MSERELEREQNTGWRCFVMSRRYRATWPPRAGTTGSAGSAIPLAAAV